VVAAESARRKALALAAVCGMRLGTLTFLSEQPGGDGEGCVRAAVCSKWELHADVALS